MKWNSLLIFLVGFLIACNSNKRNILTENLNAKNLQEQTFELNTDADTILSTLSGTKITIAANSIKSDGKTITLQVKEAITIQQIMLAGLVTTSKGRTLRSGGMIYVNTKEKSRIIKPIKISVPANTIDTGMKLYKGDITSDSSIEWKDPQSLASIDTSYYVSGKNLFSNNCASCHAIDRELTGPALRGVTKRVSERWLYAFTKNNQALIEAGDEYANEIYRKYNKTQMNLFPNLTKYHIDAVYAYIENKNTKDESRYLYSDSLDEKVRQCLDSCSKLHDGREAVTREIENLESEEKPLTDLIYKPDSSALNQIISKIDPIDRPASVTSKVPVIDKVVPESNEANYYNFTVEAYGWFNVDQMLNQNQNFLNSKVTVSIKKSEHATVETFLVIPSIKVFVKGGKLTSDSLYGFYSVNGDIPLPQGEEAFVFAMGEVDNKTIFEITKFFTNTEQKIFVEAKELPEDSILESFKSFKFPNLILQIDEVKNRAEIDSLSHNLEKLNSIMSQNCKCAGDSATYHFE